MVLMHAHTQFPGTYAGSYPDTAKPSQRPWLSGPFKTSRHTHRALEPLFLTGVPVTPVRCWHLVLTEDDFLLSAELYVSHGQGLLFSFS